MLAALSYLYQLLLSVAKENPSEQQTYLNIELVVHFTKTTPSEQHPSENLLKSRSSSSLCSEENPYRK